jgi:hypothetical protein
MKDLTSLHICPEWYHSWSMMDKEIYKWKQQKKN